MFTEELFTRALSGDLTEIRRIPKADLHSHLLLSAPFRIFQEIRAATPVPAGSFFGFADFDRYIFTELLPCLSAVENIRRVVRAAFEQMSDDGVIYAETSVDVMTAAFAEISWTELAEVLKEEILRFSSRMKVRLDLGISRGMHGRGGWEEAVEQALETGVFSAVDLYGDEFFCEVREFAAFFDSARRRNLRVKLHTGERRQSGSMLAELEAVAPDAVQHGFTAAGDSDVVRRLIERRITLNMAPTSNVRLGFVKQYGDHPIRELFDSGVPVTINTDDFTIFGQSLSEEYLNLYRCGLFTADELERVRLIGLAANA